MRISLKMRKVAVIASAGIIFLVGLLFLANIQVTTRRGVDYQECAIKMPLYLKILDFYDRHYNYILLTKSIIQGAKSEEVRVIKIFEWTYSNIKKPQPLLPIIDDHVWYTIVRGYGARDQFSDIFTTLCNYAGIEAFFLWIYSKDQAAKLPLSFVNLGGSWRVFDPYFGAYFKDKQGRLADIDTLKAGLGWTMLWLGQRPQLDYSVYFSNIPTIKEIGYRRANLQSPLRRLAFEIKKALKR